MAEMTLPASLIGRKFRAWAIFDHRGNLHCIHNGYSIYRTKREALLDCDEGCTVRRVSISEMRVIRG